MESTLMEADACLSSSAASASAAAACLTGKGEEFSFSFTHGSGCQWWEAFEVLAPALSGLSPRLWLVGAPHPDQFDGVLDYDQLRALTYLPFATSWSSLSVSLGQGVLSFGFDTLSGERFEVVLVALSPNRAELARTLRGICPGGYRMLQEQILAFPEELAPLASFHLRALGVASEWFEHTSDRLADDLELLSDLAPEVVSAATVLAADFTGGLATLIDTAQLMLAPARS